MRIPLSVPFKTRTGAPDKDAKLKNSYTEVRRGQSIVRKRPIAQGGVSIGTGTAQGGIGLNIAGTDYIYTFNGDTGALDTLATAGTTYAAGTSYSIGDHVSAGFIDYWSLTDANVGNTPSSSPASWSTSYVPAVPSPYATWGEVFQMALSNGDLTATSTVVTEDTSVVSTLGKSTGKWYWEVTATASCYFGVATGNTLPPADARTSILGAGEVGTIALDMDAGIAYLYINNVLDSTKTGLTGTQYALSKARIGDYAITANFGASAFTYSVPGGYNSGLYT